MSYYKSAVKKIHSLMLATLLLLLTAVLHAQNTVNVLAGQHAIGQWGFHGQDIVKYVKELK